MVEDIKEGAKSSEDTPNSSIEQIIEIQNTEHIILELVDEIYIEFENQLKEHLFNQRLVSNAAIYSLSRAFDTFSLLSTTICEHDISLQETKDTVSSNCALFIEPIVSPIDSRAVGAIKIKKKRTYNPFSSMGVKNYTKNVNCITRSISKWGKPPAAKYILPKEQPEEESNKRFRNRSFAVEYVEDPIDMNEVRRRQDISKILDKENQRRLQKRRDSRRLRLMSKLRVATALGQSSPDDVIIDGDIENEDLYEGDMEGIESEVIIQDDSEYILGQNCRLVSKKKVCTLQEDFRSDLIHPSVLFEKVNSNGSILISDSSNSHAMTNRPFSGQGCAQIVDSSPSHFVSWDGENNEDFDDSLYLGKTSPISKGVILRHGNIIRKGEEYNRASKNQSKSNKDETVEPIASKKSLEFSPKTLLTDSDINGKVDLDIPEVHELSTESSLTSNVKPLKYSKKSIGSCRVRTPSCQYRKSRKVVSDSFNINKKVVSEMPVKISSPQKLVRAPTRLPKLSYLREFPTSHTGFIKTPGCTDATHLPAIQ